MKKNVLYVSDLDGTLLDSKKRITPYTANVLNQCIQKGMKFAVATAECLMDATIVCRKFGWIRLEL